MHTRPLCVPQQEARTQSCSASYRCPECCLCQLPATKASSAVSSKLSQTEPIKGLTQSHNAGMTETHQHFVWPANAGVSVLCGIYLKTKFYSCLNFIFLKTSIIFCFFINHCIYSPAPFMSST